MLLINTVFYVKLCMVKRVGSEISLENLSSSRLQSHGGRCLLFKSLTLLAAAKIKDEALKNVPSKAKAVIAIGIIDHILSARAIETAAVESCTAALSNGTSLKRQDTGVECITFALRESVPCKSRCSRSSSVTETALGVSRQRSAAETISNPF
jgi:hypothetical protein